MGLAPGPITIKDDGSIDPIGTTIISTGDNFTYTFNGDVPKPIVVQRSNIVLDGAGWALMGSTVVPLSNGIILTSVNNVTVKNTNITNCQYGINLDPSSYNNNISGNIVWANTAIVGCGIYLNSSSGNTLSGNIVWANMLGIWLDSSSDNKLVDNNVTKNLDYGLKLQSSSNNKLLENNVTGNLWGGIYLVSSYNNMLLENNVTGNGQGQILGGLNGIFLANSSSNNMTRNNITANKDYGVFCSRSWNNTVYANNITANDVGVCVSLLSGNITIQANNITANIDWGILLASPNNTVYANNIEDNKGGGGVGLPSPSNTVHGNNITNNDNDGVVISSNNNTVYANNITANKEFGVYLYKQVGATCSNNEIYGNNITTNGNKAWYGVYLYMSPNNEIYGNNITDNGNYGIRLWDSDDNMIHGNNLWNNMNGGVSLVSSNNNDVYHNSFRGNPPLADNTNSMNTAWDQGYPYGGNYWSNYDGTDTDNDGVGDTPYKIDATITDNYPLKSEHHVVVTTLYKTAVAQNYSMKISATVSNCGTYDEDVNLTILANTTLIYQTVATLTPAQLWNIPFTWNVSDCALYDNYTLTACASPVSEGTSFLEHNCTGDCVTITLLGDIDGSKKVDMKDIGTVAKAFGNVYNATDGWYWNLPTTAPSTRANPNCDIDDSGKVDMKDIGFTSKHFMDQMITLNVTADANGSVSPSGVQLLILGYTVYSGLQYSFTAKADTGYQIDHWELAGENVSSAETYLLTPALTMDGQTLTVTFKARTITLHVGAGANGAVVPNGPWQVPVGSTEQFTALPDDGYQIDHWELNRVNIGSNATLDLIITADMNDETLIAYFTLKPPVTITLAVDPPTGGGSTTPDVGPQQFIVGTLVIFTATATTDYVFDHWDLSGHVYSTNPLQLPIVLDMNNTTLTAHFIIRQSG